jgi:alpha-tubulin suppressor-like RCC1 family protein
MRIKLAFSVLIALIALSLPATLLPPAAAAPGDGVAERVFGQPDFTSSTCNNGGIGATSLCSPAAAAADASGNVYLVDQGNNRILQYDTPLTTDLVADRVFGQGGSFSSSGCNAGGRSASSLCFPAGIALDAAGNLYVADRDNRRVLQFNTPLTTDTVADRVFGQGGSFTTDTCNLGGISSSSLCQPVDVATDAAGNLYVSEGTLGNNRVLEYNTPLTTDTLADRVFGQPSFTSGTPNNGGISATSLSNPVGLEVDSAGNLYVADINNHRVLAYNTPLTTNNVADRVFGQGGSFTSATCNNGGVSASSLCLPFWLASDAMNNLYVSDRNNARVLIYDAPLSTDLVADDVLGQGGSFTSTGCNTGGISASSVCSPGGLALDGARNLYLPDASTGGPNQRVVQLDVPVPAAVSSIAVGNIHTCALLSNSTARCWGAGTEAQLGNGNLQDSRYPLPVAGLSGATVIEASNAAYHTCVLAGESTAKCWGSNVAGELGIGSFGGHFPTPQTVTVAGISSIASDFRHTCALGTDGAVSCWGLNSDGQLGDGTTTDRSSPTAVIGLPDNATVVATGLNRTCAIVGGTIYCWGLGLGVTPTAVPGITTAIDVAVGNNHHCAVLSGGGARCWGQNQSGELGNGTFVGSSTPVVVSGITDAASIDVGGAHSCAVRASGQVACWGENGAGQLGDNSTVDRNVPITASGLTGAAQVATGGIFTCARLTDGSVSCWGSNFYGQLGTCSLVDHLIPTPVDMVNTHCDSDGDALPDSWELTGDLDGDGDLDLNLPAMGADPAVKDLFIEVDWMDCAVSGSDCAPGHDDSVDPLALEAVIAHFWCAPERIVAHIDAGPLSVMDPDVDNCVTRRVTGPIWGALAAGSGVVHTSAQGLTATDTRGPNRTNVFHLAQWQHAVPDIAPGRPAGGYGQVPGDRTWYGMGAFTYPRPVTNTERWQAQASVFIHELGHNLALLHGGNQEVNYKANYLSKMNYMFGAGLIANGTINQNWDYSRADLDDLDESALSEGAAVDPNGLVSTPTLVLGTGWVCPNGAGIMYPGWSFGIGVALDASANVDWNCSDNETGFAAGTCVDAQDNDGDGLRDQQDPDCTADPGTVSGDIGGGPAGPSGSLGTFTGNNDWAMIVFDGAAIGDSPGAGAMLVPSAGALHADDIDPPPFPDTDGDTLLDVGESAHGTNPLDADSDDDGIEDGEELGQLGTDPLDVDADDDACSDGEEIGDSLALGGLRNPADPWDFADVPTPPLPNVTAIRDAAVSLGDVASALQWFGALDDDVPNATGRDYDDDSNGNSIEDGREYDRSPAGVLSGPPDGAVSLIDAAVILNQFGADCTAAPN